MFVAVLTMMQAGICGATETKFASKTDAVSNATSSDKAVSAPTSVAEITTPASEFFTVNTKEQLKANYLREENAKTAQIKGANVSVKTDGTTDAIEPPYSQTFDDSSSISLYTIIDANNDGSTWTWTNSNGGKLRYTYHSSNVADDWIITPPIKLTGGCIYEVSFTSRCLSTTWAEKLEVKYGTECSAAGMTKLLMDTTLVPSSDYLYTYKIVAETDGNYYIGFHAVSEPNKFYLYVDDISISAPIKGSTPAAVSDLVLTPSYNENYNATLTFKAPTTDLAGNTLESLSKIEISRNDTLVNTIENPIPGNGYSYTEVLEAGITYEYTVVAYAEDGTIGESASTSCYTGPLVPTAPTDITIEETNTAGEVTINWVAPTISSTGLPMVKELITYTIADIDGNVIVSNITSTTYTFKAVEADKQTFTGYLVYAVTEAGQAYGITDMIAVGTPYPIPYVESFTNCKTSYIMATGDAVYDAYWSIYDDETSNRTTSYDHDNGFALMSGPYIGASASLCTGKISLTGTNPGLIMNVFHLHAGSETPNTNTIEIQASTNNGMTWTSVKSVTISELSDQEGWCTMMADLTAYAGQTVCLKFIGTINAYTSIAIDNIRIQNIENYSLTSGSITAPSTINPDTDFEVIVTIENNGVKNAEGFSLTLYKNNSAISLQEGLTLASSKIGTYSFAQNLSTIDDENNEYYAVVTYEQDATTTDNTTSIATTTLNIPILPRPTDLKAYINDDANAVSLYWSAPDITSIVPKASTEDFEEAEAWANEYGNWKFVDMDGELVGGFYGIEIPNHPRGSADGFFVLDTTHDNFNTDATFTANSGAKYLASMYNIDKSATDNWLISPELYGTAQTITFFAKSYDGDYPESVRVDYSTTDNETSSFTETALTVSSIPNKWTQYSFNVPNGTKYFAIRSVAADAFMLMLDDVAFVAAGAEATDAKISGYNVYRNKVKINSELVSATTETISYIDQEFSSMDAKYIVTAVIEGRGESAGSNEASIEKDPTVGVNNAIKDVTNIYSNNGNIIVCGAEGQTISIFTADGCLISTEETEVAKTVIPAQQGIYIVKAGPKTAKVIVK